MAQVKNYGLIGVGTEIQLGKQGPKLKGNADSDTISVTNEGGSVLTTIEAANATAATHLVTKAQLDASASQTFIKSNLAAVYSDSNIATGDIIKVTADADGEYAVYLADQDAPSQLSHLTLISTKDGAQTDANTYRANVTYNGGNVTLGDVSTTSRPQEVVVDVTTAFDGTTSVNVGDDSDNDRLMSNDYIDLGTVGTYTVTPKFVYMDTTDANNTIKAYVVAGTSTQGAASIMVTYS